MGANPTGRRRTALESLEARPWARRWTPPTWRRRSPRTNKREAEQPGHPCASHPTFYICSSDESYGEYPAGVDVDPADLVPARRTRARSISGSGRVYTGNGVTGPRLHWNIGTPVKRSLSGYDH